MSNDAVNFASPLSARPTHPRPLPGGERVSVWVDARQHSAAKPAGAPFPSWEGAGVGFPRLSNFPPLT
jgi:hypothetical protein